MNFLYLSTISFAFISNLYTCSGILESDADTSEALLDLEIDRTPEVNRMNKSAQTSKIDLVSVSMQTSSSSDADETETETETEEVEEGLLDSDRTPEADRSIGGSVMQDKSSQTVFSRTFNLTDASAKMEISLQVDETDKSLSTVHDRDENENTLLPESSPLSPLNATITVKKTKKRMNPNLTDIDEKNIIDHSVSTVSNEIL
jgi:hypothetical protein